MAVVVRKIMHLIDCMCQACGEISEYYWDTICICFVFQSRGCRLADVNEEVDSMLSHTALGEHKKSKISKLSESQKRKVSIILALVGGPKVSFVVLKIKV